MTFASLSGERRRFPRQDVSVDVRASLSLIADVEIIDISESGLLLSSPWPLQVGERVQVRALFERKPLITHVEVVRVDDVVADSRGRFTVAVRMSAVPDWLKTALRP